MEFSVPPMVMEIRLQLQVEIEMLRATMMRSRSSRPSVCEKPRKLLHVKSKRWGWVRRQKQSPTTQLLALKGCMQFPMEVVVLVLMVVLQVHLKAQNLLLV